MRFAFGVNQMPLKIYRDATARTPHALLAPKIHGKASASHRSPADPDSRPSRINGSTPRPRTNRSIPVSSHRAKCQGVSKICIGGFFHCNGTFPLMPLRAIKLDEQRSYRRSLSLEWESSGDAVRRADRGY